MGKLNYWKMAPMTAVEKQLRDAEAASVRRLLYKAPVVHEMMLTARKGLPGHAIYALVRNASELIESCGREREHRCKRECPLAVRVGASVSVRVTGCCFG